LLFLLAIIWAAPKKPTKTPTNIINMIP